MGRLRKVSHKDAPLVSSVESVDSLKDPFVPNDFADDASNAMSLDCSGDDSEFDKALFNFYVNNKVKYLKRKISSASRRNVRQKRSSDFPSCSTFTRYSGKFFSGVVDSMCPRYKGVIEHFGMSCLLNFVRTELKRKFIPLTKYDIHNILDLPVDGQPLVCDPESGRDFILSHFNLTSIPPVSFFANKLKSVEVDLPDEDVFICFMIVAFSTFLCPNSSLSPSPKYLHIFWDCPSVCEYDLSNFVYEWLLGSIKKFKDATKVASKRSVTFGGCHYAFAVSYLDHLNFGLHSVPDVKPRILAWRGNTVKQFAELDRNNSRSFGKRPLKRLCAPLNLQGSVGKSSGSKSLDIGPSDGTFAMKVQRTIAPRFGSQTALEVIQLVESTNQDKPKIFLDWAESLVLNVLDCLLHSSIPKVCASENHSMSKFSFGNKSVSIQSAIANREFVKVADIQETEVQKETQHLSSPVTPVVPPPVLDGGLDNPVVLSSSSTPAKVCPEAVVSQDAIPVRTLICEAKSNSASVPPAQPTAAPKGNSPSICKGGIPDVDSVVVLSDGPAKEKVGVNTFGIPSLSELNRALGIQSLAEVCNDTLVNGDRNSHMEDTNSFRGLSPIVPIRLSQYFHNEVGDVQCSQYVADRYMKSFDSPRSEDCVVMVNTPNSDISTNHVDPQTVDLCSPDILKTSHQDGMKVNEVVVDVHKVGSSTFTPRCQELYRSSDVAYNKLPNFAAPATSGRNPLKANKAVVDVRKVGTSIFTARCQELSRSNDVAYNKLHNFAASSTSGHNPLKVANSPELEIMSVKPAVSSAHLSEVAGCSNAAPTSQFPGASTVSLSGGHVPRRMVVPGRFNSDPYVPQVNRYSVTQLERRNHLAMIQIASHPEWCKYEAIRFERAYCSYRNLSSLQFKSHVDNFLILCVCRYLFNETHPSVSKKHFFFSYIGETILDGINPEIVGNAFNGASSAFAIWRSNMLYFPICRFNHWFSFVVCLKDRLFVFLDSFYGQFSDFHLELRDRMVNNFVNIWDMFMSPIMRKRIDFKSFEIVYPAVPQQNNTDDCGVFNVMYMKHWTPRTPIGNLFSSADIDNIRIKLANELYFSPFNTADKSFVTNFFADEQN